MNFILFRISSEYLPDDSHEIETCKFFDKCFGIIELQQSFKKSRDALCPLKSGRCAFYPVKVRSDTDMVFPGNRADMFDMPDNIVDIRFISIIKKIWIKLTPTTPPLAFMSDSCLSVRFLQLRQTAIAFGWKL